jgi:hypothetical protein
VPKMWEPDHRSTVNPRSWTPHHPSPPTMQDVRSTVYYRGAYRNRGRAAPVTRRPRPNDRPVGPAFTTTEVLLTLSVGQCFKAGAGAPIPSA